MRVYGTILLLLLSVLVFIGVRVVNYFALFCLACVLVSMVSIYLGIIVHSFLPVLSVCTLGGVALEGKYCILVTINIYLNSNRWFIANYCLDLLSNHSGGYTH